MGVFTIGAAGVAVIETLTATRSLSQPLTVWLAYHVNVPGVVVEGVGGVAVPVPPIAIVYHLIATPVALSGFAVSPWQ